MAGPWEKYAATAPPADAVPTQGPWAKYAAAAPLPAPVQATPPAQSPLLDNPVVGGAEDLLHHVTGGLAQVPAVIAGGAAGLGRVTGVTPNVDPEAIRQSVQNKFTYQPVSNSGQAGLETERHFLAPAGAVVGKAIDSTGAAAPYIRATARGAGAALAAAPFESALSAVGDAAAPLARSATDALKITSPEVVPRPNPSIVEGAAAPSVQAPLQTARGVGYKAPPSVVQASNPTESVPGVRREGIVGPSGIRADAATENQGLTTRLVGQDIGLKDAKKITPQDTATFRKNGPGPTYDMTSIQLGKMKDATATAELRRLASNTDPASALPNKAATNVERIAQKIESGNYTGQDWLSDVSWLRQNGARSAANSLEDMAERALAGDSQSLNAYRNARADFAKSYDVERAIGRGGQIDAHYFRELDDKYPGLLTGNAKIVATAARELPEVTRLPGSESGEGIHSRWQAVHNALGSVVKKIPGMNPMSEGFQARNFGREQTPTEATYNRTFGKQPEPLSEALQLKPPTGEVGTAPSRQTGMELPQGPPAAPSLQLQPPDGVSGTPTQYQLGELNVLGGRSLGKVLSAGTGKRGLGKTLTEKASVDKSED